MGGGLIGDPHIYRASTAQAQAPSLVKSDACAPKSDEHTVRGELFCFCCVILGKKRRRRGAMALPRPAPELLANHSDDPGVEQRAWGLNRTHGPTGVLSFAFISSKAASRQQLLYVLTLPGPAGAAGLERGRFLGRSGPPWLASAQPHSFIYHGMEGLHAWQKEGGEGRMDGPLSALETEERMDLCSG